MFEFASSASSQGDPLRRGVAFAVSAALHAGVVGSLVWLVVAPPASEEDTGVAVMFIKPAARPPPPPPAAKKVAVRTRAPEKIVAPTVVLQKPPEPESKPAEPEEPDEGEETGAEGGAEGGVPGGAIGGVAGGTVGGTVGDAAPEPVKSKNVPPFVIQRDLIRQTPPRLSEVFRQSHRNSPPISGLYRVCVGKDGRVYEVTPVKSIPGADDDIAQGIKDGYEYKPQQVPVCFLYNVNISIKE